MQKILKAELSDQCGLTKAVKRVFEEKAVGKTSQEVADFLYKSIKTIDRQTTLYLQALECKNTQQAIAKTVADGVLTFRYITKSILLVVCISAVTGDQGVIRPKNSRGPLSRIVRARSELA